jgi:alpha-glucosidase
MSTAFSSVRSNSLGNLTSWHQQASGITGVTDNGEFRIVFYNDAIVRVSVSTDSHFDDFSYAVVASVESTKLNVQESEREIVISTAKVVAKIQKHPVRISFVDPDGSVINEDDPSFGTSWNGEQVTTYKRMQDGERFIGLGEKTGPLDRKGNGYQNWTTDSFAYSPGQDPLYCSTPFYIGVHHNLAYGIFFDNTYKSFFNFGASNNRFSSFSADAGEMNYYFIYGHNVAEILREYSHLTGRIELPPLWSLGYQQCRYSYYPDKEVLSVARTFREKDIPADTIVFDIHYMDKYKIFTWSERDFPDPKGLLDELRSMGFNVVIMCDPGIKTEEGYPAYDDGNKKNVFLKYPDGSNYSGQVWPGWCNFPDFTDPNTRTWWKEQFKEYIELGVEGFWNDMNEPATWGHMLPENLEFSFDGNKATTRRGRNVYGFQMARSTYEGAKALLKGKRPFNLTRSGFCGVQRYGAVWTGDNVAYDEHMMLGVRIVNSMGLTGIPFAGYDVGGFVGDASTKLFARWISIGAFSPFYRGHSMINSRDAEPWAFGEEVEQIARNYIKFRYQLLPYLYSLFFEASQTGMPIQRSLAIDYTHDPKIYDGRYDNQYLFGPYMLVCPVESNKDFVKVYLPHGEWYSLYDGTRYPGNTEFILECPVSRLPVFVKSGAIVPLQKTISNTATKNEELILHVYDGHDKTSFQYYEDDGSTFSYQNGNFHKRTIEFYPLERKLILKESEGPFKSSLRKLRVVFHGLRENSHGLKPEINMFFPALEKFDPFFDPAPAPQENVHTLERDYTSAEIIITW